MFIENAFNGWLVSLGERPNGLEVPAFNHAGQLTLEPGETVIGDRQNTMQVFKRPKGKDWHTMELLESPATIVLTNRRVIYSWPNWKSDRSGGSFFERRVLSALLEREDGKLIIASHVRFPWIQSVSRRATMKGIYRKRAVCQTLIHFSTKADSFRIDFTVEFTGLEVAQADAIAEAIAKAVATERIERRASANNPMTDENYDQVAAVSMGGGDTQHEGGLRMFWLPGAKYAPFDYDSD